MSALDIFLVVGQSNAAGGGTAGAPVPQDKVLKWTGTSIAQAIDPVTPGATGTAWPSFGLTYYQLTGRPCLLVVAAVGGTAQVAAADDGTGNWDISGTLVATALQILDNAFRGARNEGYSPRLKGVLWCQGERDALKIADGTITASTYKAAWTTMAARFRTTYGLVPMYVFKTGTDPLASDAGYCDIRVAQEEMVAADPYSRIVFSDAICFPWCGMATTIHYNQTGYNWMGRSSATSVASGVNPPLEGTWTPTLIGDSGAATHSVQIGSFDKIGRHVTARFSFTATNQGSIPSGNSLYISGLPGIVAKRTSDNGIGKINVLQGVSYGANYGGVAGFAWQNGNKMSLSQMPRDGATGPTGFTTANLWPTGSQSVLEGVIHFKV